MMQTCTPKCDKTIYGKKGQEKSKSIFEQSERITLFYLDAPFIDNREQTREQFIEDVRENILACGGQFLFLNLAEQEEEPLAVILYDALNAIQPEENLGFSLPSVLRRQPQTMIPFLKSAIQWQRLCDLFVRDNEPNRPSVLLLEDVHHASQATQRDIVRLVRFHQTYSISRTFIFMFQEQAQEQSQEQLIPELRELLQCSAIGIHHPLEYTNY